ncbi:MAG: DUF3558 domain-containing protein [Actinophytocola sp.]|uniref:DUF3558 domain-containing protein n=1 Tax=Actinophytocola sp. TaxID=1872138 RepID=UPI003D6AA4A5
MLAVGCTDSTGGVATPGGGDSGNESSVENPSEVPSSNSAPTEEIPPRPRELSLEGVKPCSLLTPTQLGQLRSQLQLDNPPRSYTSTDAHYKAPTCGLEQSREPFDAIDLMVVTSEGAESWLTGDRNVDAWLVSVGGFPAVDYKIKGSEDVECVTALDVADGQQMIVDFIPLERRDYKELCQVTEQVAAMALQTLQTLR